MTAPPISATTMKIANWIRTRLDNGGMSAPLIPVIRSDKRIAGGVRARHLADRAAPLQLQLRQIALEPRAR